MYLVYNSNQTIPLPKLLLVTKLFLLGSVVISRETLFLFRSCTISSVEGKYTLIFMCVIFSNACHLFGIYSSEMNLRFMWVLKASRTNILLSLFKSEARFPHTSSDQYIISSSFTHLFTYKLT